MAHRVVGMILLALVAGGTAGAGQADEDDEIEWSYARPAILRQAGPQLGRHSFRAVLQAAFPKLRAPDKHVEEGDPVIGQLLALRGRFLAVDDEQVGPGPHAVALLAVWETVEEESTYWRPELVVVGLVGGRLVVLGRQQLDDLEHDFMPAQDGGSAYRLEAWPLHPKAAGIGVRLDRIFSAPGEQSANAVQMIVFVGLPEDGDEDGELFDVFMRDVVETSMEHETGAPAYGQVSRVQVRIDRQRMISGLYMLETESHTSSTEGGRLRHVEIDYEWYCWADGSFDSCDEEQLDPAAPLQQAR